MNRFFLTAIGLLVSVVAMAQQWEPVPLASKKVKDAGGGIGGEGGQIITAIHISPAGDYMLMGTNTGGVYRRERAGGRWRPWQPANPGFNSRGASCFAIDPRNPNRVIGVGASASVRADHGMYLSTDKGKTWRATQLDNMTGDVKGKLMLAWDPTSYDAKIGGSAVAYWNHWGTTDGKDDGDTLWKTTDGGRTWRKISDLGYRGMVQVHSGTGEVFYAGREGLFRSPKGGMAFAKIASGAFTGLHIPRGNPKHVWACTANKVYHSTNGGRSFGSFTPGGLGTPSLSNIRASGVNANHLMISHKYGSGWWAWNACRSLDGGKTFTQLKNKDTRYYEHDRSFFPLAPREGTYLWSDTDARSVWAVGGDAVYHSTNAGLFFDWDNEGNTGVMLGETFNFNPHRPDAFFLGFQDKNVAWTDNRGSTWHYIDWSGKGHGHVYGGIMTDKAVIATLSDSWGGTRRLMRKTDRGPGRAKDMGVVVRKLELAYVDPKDEAVVFMGEHRSTDHGASWKKANGADGVFMHNYDPKGDQHLIGYQGGVLKRSTNKGASWQTIVDLKKGTIGDAAYDYRQGRYYVVASRGLYAVDAKTKQVANLTRSLKADQFGRYSVRSVAVDPVDPNVVYVASRISIYSEDNAIQRSVDGGKTWRVLTKAPRHNNVDGGIDGARIPSWVRVHPKSRYLWVGTGCYGIWKLAPPGGAQPRVAPVKITATNTDFIRQATATLATATPGAKIYYTLDGSTPTARATPYTKPVTITRSLTLRAIATKSGMRASQPTALRFTKQPAQARFPYVATAPNIDGRADAAWGQATEQPIAIKGPGTVDNAQDLSGHFKGLWGDKGLYIWVSATDNRHMVDSDQQYWQDDGVEVYIDANNAKTATYQNDDFQFVFRQGYPAVEAKHKRVDGVRKAFQTTAQGYVMEAFLPWALLRKTPGANALLGIEVQLADDDDGGPRDGKLAWHDGTDKAWQSPAVFGTALLAGGANSRLGDGLGTDAGQIAVYPNPFREAVLLGRPTGWVLYGPTGQALRRGQGSRIATGPLVPGLYLLQLANGQSHKIIKR